MPAKQLDEEALFHVVRQIAAGEARELFIAQACGGDAGLAERVRALVEMHEREPESAEAPPLRTADYEPVAERPGERIGLYRLMEQIGEGGFGLVFVAEQQEPVKRKVALKVIKPGMDTRQVIARFEAERQALALMDHPNIARVLDAGATDSGRPYFVMELVRGISITEYCDRNQLAPRDRLELFVTVCQAVQHAHQKGIIHRDIKPSNVLVTSHDGKPVPKIIDFGVAKAINQQLTERTIYTQFTQMIGTPLYMSPEQAEMSGLDIDTRSDIFSLGVLLYELLTGTTPLEKRRLAKAAYDEIRRMIRDEEPPKPSSRLSQSGDSLPSIAAQRHTEPAKLSKLMRGDLDWITMKCLEKDRTRRYETASGLARDIERHLADEPVEACPPSATYRLRKLAKKHKAGLATAVAIAALLVAGITVSTWQAVRATNAERAALAARQAETEQAEGERQAKQAAQAAAAAEKQAKETAETSEAENKAVLDFVESKVFAAARPLGQDGGLGRDVTLRNAIEAALPVIERSFPKQPLIEARLRVTIGDSLGYLGDAKAATEQHLAARALYAQYRGPDHPDTLTSMHKLSNAYDATGRTQEALQLREETLQLRNATLGPDHPDTLKSKSNLANSYESMGRNQEALKIREELLPIQKAKLGPDHLDTLTSMFNLARSYFQAGRTQEALKLREEMLPLFKSKFGLDHLNTLGIMNNLAESYFEVGRLQEGLKLHEESLQLMKAKLGPDHPDTLICMGGLAFYYDADGRTREALELREETLRLQKAKLGPEHPDTLASMVNLGISYTTAGRVDDSIKLYEEALPVMKAKMPDHQFRFNCMIALAASYAAAGRTQEALKLREETLALQKTKLGPHHRATLSHMTDLANSYGEVGRTQEALQLREETLSLQKASLGPDHPDTLASMVNLGISYATAGRVADAIKLYEEALPVLKAKMPNHQFTINCMAGLVESYSAAGRTQEALQLREALLQLQKAKLGANHPDTE